MDIMETVKALGSALGFIVILYGGFWLKKIFDQRKRNALNEIDLSARKISLENSAKPLDSLVSDSNKSHGAGENEVVGSSRSDSKKK